jgi:nucleoside permease NupC
LLPGKYLLLGALIWALLRYDLIQPFAFVMGVPLVQVVITAKAVGRLMMRNRSSIRQAYVEKGKRNAV